MEGRSKLSINLHKSPQLAGPIAQIGLMRQLQTRTCLYSFCEESLSVDRASKVF